MASWNIMVYVCFQGLNPPSRKVHQKLWTRAVLLCGLFFKKRERGEAEWILFYLFLNLGYANHDEFNLRKRADPILRIPKKWSGRKGSQQGGGWWRHQLVTQFLKKRWACKNPDLPVGPGFTLPKPALSTEPPNFNHWFRVLLGGSCNDGRWIFVP